MEENKYYTPSIEEFHIGFEYEWLQENKEWKKENSPIEITIDGFELQKYGLRVKFLDKTDIKLLGWVFEEEKDGKLIFSKSEGFFKTYLSLANRNNIPYVKIWMLLRFKNDESDTISNMYKFQGYIKNISVLKNILELIEAKV